MKIKLSDISDGKLSQDEATVLQKYFKDGGTWQDLLQLNEMDVEEVYAQGHALYSSQEFEKAMAAFSALIQLNPYVAKHWVAIGATLQAQKTYEDALAAYDMALALDKEHMGALFYSAQCSFLLEKNDEAISFLQRLVAVNKEHGKDPSLAEKATKILTMMGR